MVHPLPVGVTVHVQVPASSANLGPGFDSLGLALDMHDEVVVTTVDSGLNVRVEGEGFGDVPCGPGHLVVRALERGLDAAGVSAPGLDLVCHNVIPHARGLGSSAAAVVAGVVAANGLAAKVTGDAALSDAQLVQLASEFEGHPDNAAAGVLGGLVVSWTESHRHGPRYRAVRVHPAVDVRATVLIPVERSATSHTRGLLPETVPHRDAAFNVARAALAVVAFTGRADLLSVATEDRLHQDYRAGAWPLTARWLTRLRERGLAAVVSGAGPTVLVPHTGQFPDDLRKQAIDEGLRVMDLGLAEGARVR